MRAIRYCWQSVKKLLTIDSASVDVDSAVAVNVSCDQIHSDMIYLPEFMPYSAAIDQLPKSRHLTENRQRRRFALPNSRNNFMLKRFRALQVAVICGVVIVLAGISPVLIAADNAGEFGSAIDYTMYKLAVERNDANAQYLVGRNFLIGKTVTKNVNEAIKWLKRAAEQDHQQAQFTLGKIYFYGNGVKRNTELGLKYIEKAAENRLDEAQLFLGGYYLGNNGGKTNLELAKKWLLSAAEYNNPRAQYQYGKLLIESGNDKDSENALRWIQNASDAGLLEATKLLKRLRPDSKGPSGVVASSPSVFAPAVVVNDHNANATPAKLDSTMPSGDKNAGANDANIAPPAKSAGNQAESKAAKADSIAKVKVDSSISIRPASQVGGKGSGSFFTEAKLSDAEKQLSPGKQFNLAMDYINGEHGVKKDLSRGMTLLIASAHRDNPRAQYSYGLMLRDGAGVDKDLTEALNWLQKAASAGLANAKREYDNLKLNAMLKNGDSNPDKPAAQFSLGLRLLKGEGVKQDEVEAAKWILKAAKQNHHEAEARIGNMYRQGIGVEKNTRQAKRWLEKAASAGVISASRELKELDDETFTPDSLKAKNLADSDNAETAALLQKTALSEPPLTLSSTALNDEENISIGLPGSRSATTKAANSSRAKPVKTAQSKPADKNTVQNNQDKPKSAPINNGVVAMLDNTQVVADDLVIDKNSNLFPLLRLAENGDKGAQYEFAVQLLATNNSKQASDEAIKWLTLAANNKHLSAQKKLANLYQSGSQVKRDLKKAYDCFLLAATSGDDEAQLKLGDMYRNGEGVSSDNSEAIRWYRMSANQGNQEARHRLGGCTIC